MSAERQNQLHVYRHVDDVIEERLMQILDTLAPGKQRKSDIRNSGSAVRKPSVKVG